MIVGHYEIEIKIEMSLLSLYKYNKVEMQSLSVQEKKPVKTCI